jgi:predicted cobalt transporter CbtA
MSKKFDADAYVARWDAKVIPAMIACIVVSLVLAIMLNVATRPDCLRHEYVFCGTEAVQHGHEEGTEGHGAGKASHGAEDAHGAQPH